MKRKQSQSAVEVALLGNARLASVPAIVTVLVTLPLAPAWAQVAPVPAVPGQSRPVPLPAAPAPPAAVPPERAPVPSGSAPAPAVPAPPAPAPYPASGWPQQGYYSQLDPLPPEAVLHALAAAQNDAQEEVSRLFPLAAAFLLHAGVLWAYTSDPSPPATRLMGMPPAYAEVYTAAYHATGKAIQGRTALAASCLLPFVVTVVAGWLHP